MGSCVLMVLAKKNRVDFPYMWADTPTWIAVWMAVRENIYGVMPNRSTAEQ
jgi:hypothetical protein